VLHFEHALTELAALHKEVEYELKAITSTKYVAEVFVDGKSRARCKFWIGDRLGGDGIAYSETDFGWDITITATTSFFRWRVTIWR
jgi:hypothetical protein